LLVQGLRELPGARHANPLVHPSVLVLRPLAAAAPARVPPGDDSLVRLEERERVGRLDEVLVGRAADLVRADQPLDLLDELGPGALDALPLAYASRRAPRVPASRRQAPPGW